MGLAQRFAWCCSTPCDLPSRRWLLRQAEQDEQPGSDLLVWESGTSAFVRPSRAGTGARSDSSILTWHTLLSGTRAGPDINIASLLPSGQAGRQLTPYEAHHSATSSGGLHGKPEEPMTSGLGAVAWGQPPRLGKPGCARWAQAEPASGDPRRSAAASRGWTERDHSQLAQSPFWR